MAANMLGTVRERALALWKEHDLLGEPITVTARTLTVHEAIGDPDGDDFPLQKGKEQLMEAVFRGEKGQAFTDRFGDFSGSLADVAAMELTGNFRRAVFVSALNATCRSLGLCTGTVHCRDKEPNDCAAAFRDHIADTYGNPRIAQVGFQPKMIEILSSRFTLKVLDRDPENIGAVKHGAPVHGPEDQASILDWADLIVSTGSTLANDTIGDFLTDKPVIFYGTTVAGAAALMGWQRFCAKSR